MAWIVSLPETPTTIGETGHDPNRRLQRSCQGRRRKVKGQTVHDRIRGRPSRAASSLAHGRYRVNLLICLGKAEPLEILTATSPAPVRHGAPRQGAPDKPF